MPPRPVYSIGIDLGTTNCALCYCSTQSDAQSESVALPIPQRSGRAAAIESATLPSFLYSPYGSESAAGGDAAFGVSDGWIPGLAARERATAAPDRVVHSAKSWLCHHSVSPDARILPWKSASIDDAAKLSPIDASAALLRHLKNAWDERMSARFADQSITITVPASFDVAAQRSTLEAARRAGYPPSTRLLEEPQAAFYRWLESSSAGTALPAGQRILVVDIGGGTSDFSLFETRGQRKDGTAMIERVAVSDHILLGGDNMDLALAHALESELVSEGEELSSEQWGFLIARAREVKERCLSEEENPPASITVSIPSRGSGLLAGALSAAVDPEDARSLLLEGFFPLCPLKARPDRRASGLLEWGLPYAPDCAATRYLAEFVSGHTGRIHAVLFNGGTLASKRIQNRLLEQLALWQDGQAPVLLSNAEKDLAVARGAAYFGALPHRSIAPIAAGLARSVYLEVGAESGAPRLLCVLPQGAQPNEVVTVEHPGLQLRINQRAVFRAWQGDDQGGDEAGAIRSVNTDRFARLPPLEAVIDFSDSPEDESVDWIPVRLAAQVNELGVLSVACACADPTRGEGSWQLAFSLRGGDDAASAQLTPTFEGGSTADAKRLARARTLLREQLLSGSAKASKALKRLESEMGISRNEWDLRVSRALADEALVASAALERSDAHAENWLQLSGFALRPGFGHPNDASRLDRVWRERAALEDRAVRVDTQAAVFWRRIAPGFDAVRQAYLLARNWSLAQLPKRATAERIRLLGALERIDAERKAELARWLLERGLELSRTGGYAAPFFSALGQVLGRTLFQAGPEFVAAPEVATAAFERLRKLDWREPAYAELGPLFLRAARVTDDRAIDLPNRIRVKIAEKLEKSGLSSTRIAPILEYRPLGRADRVSYFGESLPMGLMIE